MKAILYDRKRKAERGISGQPDLMLPVTPTKTTPTNRRTPATAESGNEIISVYRQVVFFSTFSGAKRFFFATAENVFSIILQGNPHGYYRADDPHLLLAMSCVQ